MPLHTNTLRALNLCMTRRLTLSVYLRGAFASQRTSIRPLQPVRFSFVRHCRALATPLVSPHCRIAITCCCRRAAVVVSALYIVHFVLLRCREGEDESGELPSTPFTAAVACRQAPGHGCAIDSASISQVLLILRCLFAAVAGSTRRRRVYVYMQAFYYLLYVGVATSAVEALRDPAELLPIAATTLQLVATHMTIPKGPDAAGRREEVSDADAAAGMRTLRVLNLASGFLWLPYCVIVRSWSTLLSTVMVCVSGAVALMRAAPPREVEAEAQTVETRRSQPKRPKHDKVD